jgi:cell division protein ZapA
MAQVSVTIGGRLYRMACDEGQEAHLETLSADLDRRLAQMKANFGEIGDQRLTVMAAIALMDELHDVKRKLAHAEGDMQVLRDKTANSTVETQIWTNTIVDTIDHLTQRVENMVKHFSTEAK